MLRLAGARINPKTNGPHRAGLIYGITLKRIADGSETKVTVPAQANISNVRFSPNGGQVSFLNTKPNSIELWAADTATGKARLISGLDRLNAANGDPCDWLHDNTTMICKIVPAARRGAGGAQRAGGPEHSGEPGQAGAGANLRRHAEDGARRCICLSTYFTSQLAAYNVSAGAQDLDRPRRNFRSGRRRHPTASTCWYQKSSGRSRTCFR